MRENNISLRTTGTKVTYVAGVRWGTGETGKESVLPIPSPLTPAMQAGTEGRLLNSAAMLNISADVMYLNSPEALVSQKLRRRFVNNTD